MSKYGFWILLLACLLAIGALYVLQVNNAVSQLSERVELAKFHAQDAVTSSADAVGRQSLTELKEMQGLVDGQRSDYQRFFEERDAAHFDLWFANLRLPWKSAPRLEDFQRQYDLSQDRLAREASRLLAETSAPQVTINLMTPPPLTAGSFADNQELVAEMRRRQREFWVQDRLILAFARQGAWLARPLRGGESMGVASGSSGAAIFERFRFDVQVLAQPEKVLDVLHAFDSPFVYVTEEGQRIDLALNAIVDNVSIKLQDLDPRLVSKFAGEPPVLISFYLTVLDYQQKKGS